MYNIVRNATSMLIGFNTLTIVCLIAGLKYRRTNSKYLIIALWITCLITLELGFNPFQYI